MREGGNGDPDDLEAGGTYVECRRPRVRAAAFEDHALFSTRDPASAARLGEPFLGAHRYAGPPPGGDAFRATLHASVTGSITLGLLQLAAGTELALAASAARFLVVQPLRAAVQRDGRPLGTGQAAVIQPGRPCTLRSPAAAAHLLVGIEEAAVLLHLSRLLGRALDRRLVFDPELDLRAPPSRRWTVAVELLQDELAEKGSLLRSGVGVAQLEDFLISALLLGQPSTYSALLIRGVPLVGGETSQVAAEFIEANLAEHLSLGAVARAAGVSVRTLQTAFRSELRTTATAYIRSRRLERARVDLTTADGRERTVTEVATRWGITHLGRFAAEYRARYGESPSQTLRRPPQALSPSTSSSSPKTTKDAAAP